jgi:hypothetical protein
MPEDEIRRVFEVWLASCTRGGKISRNSIAVGIVVLDHLIRQAPVRVEDVISPGGEIVGSRSRLHAILRTYGVNQPEKYLKEVTTRQAHPDGKKLFEALQYGAVFDGVSDEERRRILRNLIDILVGNIQDWFNRQSIKLYLNKQHTPNQWVKEILDAAKGKSGGAVEQHLIGAMLQLQYPHLSIPNHPSHAGDVQTNRPGDFLIGQFVFHVTAAPGRNLIQKCQMNLQSDLFPVLLVPAEQVTRTKSFAEYENLEKRIMIFGLEDFVAMNALHTATDRQLPLDTVFRQLIHLYNERVSEAETDMALKIEIL